MDADWNEFVAGFAAETQARQPRTVVVRQPQPSAPAAMTVSMRDILDALSRRDVVGAAPVALPSSEPKWGGISFGFGAGIGIGVALGIAIALLSKGKR